MAAKRGQTKTMAGKLRYELCRDFMYFTYKHGQEKKKSVRS